MESKTDRMDAANVSDARPDGGPSAGEKTDKGINNESQRNDVNQSLQKKPSERATADHNNSQNSGGNP